MNRATLGLAALLSITPVLLRGVDCPTFLPRSSELLLYFPCLTPMGMACTTDPGFPSIVYVPEGGGPTFTSGAAKPFSITELDPTLALGVTEAGLINAIVGAVRTDYCEFDVKVTFTRTMYAAPSTGTRRQTVAIGTDKQPYGTGHLFGLADHNPDAADAEEEDHSRVWAGSLLEECKAFTSILPPGGIGPFTVNGWVNAIAGTISHEAAHNYGLVHGAAAPVSIEVSQNHLMSTSGKCSICNHCCGDSMVHPNDECCVFCPERYNIDRHFSDTSYGVLAKSIGLSTETLHNWDFTNPNSLQAEGLEIEVLSVDSTLVRTWYWGAATSPWIDPNLHPPIPAGPPQMFRGAWYNPFKVRWTTANPLFATPGIVPAAGKFHTGIAFSSPNPIIIVKTRLLNSTTATGYLPLSPRMIGYDKGSLPTTTCLFDLAFYNADEGSSGLCVSDVTVRFLPRMAAIETMNVSMESDPRTREGFPINVLETLQPIDPGCLEGGGVSTITLAELTDPRFVDIPAGGGGGDVSATLPPPATLPYGRVVGLFPSTYIYVTAKVTDPMAEHWDPVLEQMVTGPVETRLFYQFAGITPDCNGNEVDDLLDIDSGDSLDNNSNGMPDECESSPFRRGNADGMGGIDLTDAINILNFLFSGNAVMACRDAADTLDEGTITITSAIYLLNHLFIGGPPPPPPNLGCGDDPTVDGLGCANGGCP